MSKKLFLGMFAAAGMLLATSCSNDELDVAQSGDEAQVTFSLGLEGGIATRAISDGTGADVLMYAVFDKDGKRINTIQKVSKTKVTFPTTEKSLWLKVRPTRWLSGHRMKIARLIQYLMICKLL